mmetsp:Transcript_23111/g.58961  ORF Transcript_23111/g.58961 Transcript_23111/m.58961 type:complete len:101 (-) Transcript_23111:456-758(-)
MSFMSQHDHEFEEYAVWFRYGFCHRCTADSQAAAIAIEMLRLGESTYEHEPESAQLATACPARACKKLRPLWRSLRLPAGNAREHSLDAIAGCHHAELGK